MNSTTRISTREGAWDVPASNRRLRYRYWQPPHPRAFLLIIHGFGEHGGRYAPLASTLAERDIFVAAPDLCGHGRSSGRRGDIEDVGRCAEEVSQLTDKALLPQSGLSQYALFGHSFGGLVAISLALDHPANLRRLVIQSPLLDVGFPVPRWKVAAATWLARWWPTYSFSMDLNVEMLSHDPTVVQAYRSDPLVHNAMTARAYRSILRAQGEVFQRAGALHVPLLLLYGTADRIVSVEAMQRWCSLVPCEKRSVAFPGAYHELHHESVRDDVLQHLLDWTMSGQQGTSPS